MLNGPTSVGARQRRIDGPTGSVARATWGGVACGRCPAARRLWCCNNIQHSLVVLRSGNLVPSACSSFVRYLGSAILPAPTLTPLRIAAACSPVLSYPAEAFLHPSAIRRHQTTYMHSPETPAFDWPVDLWTSPSDRPEPYGTCGQVMVNFPVDHNLTTLLGLSPTGSTAFQQQAFQKREKHLRASAHPLGQVS